MDRLSPLGVRSANFPGRSKRRRYGSSEGGGAHRQLRLELLEDRVLLAIGPTGMEQEMLEHVNRFRMDPQGELSVLFTSLDGYYPVSPDSDVNAAINYFADPTSAEILSDWATLSPVAPLAWHESLYASATAHSQLMISHDDQSHQLPGEASLGSRISAAGYSSWSTVGENIFAYTNSVFHGYSAFVVDWAVPSRGHRNNILSTNFREIGISIISDSTPSTQVGPLVLTQDFGNRWTLGNSYLLGVVYEDLNTNGRYDAGEGFGGVDITVTGSGGTFTTTSMTAGGYQLQVPSGIYTVTASGGGLSGSLATNGVFVAASNVKADLQVGVDGPASSTVVAGDDAYSITQDSTLLVADPGVLSNDTDSDGDPLTATLLSGTANGVLTLYNDGSFSYDPTPGFQGTDSFVYTALDPLGDSDIATVTITVEEPNVAPLAVGEDFQVDVDGNLAVPSGGVLDNDTDANSDPLTAVLVTGPSHGTLTLDEDGSFYYTPASGYHGFDSFVYCANDGQLDSNVVEVTLRIMDPVGPVDFVTRLSQNPFATNLHYQIQTVRQGLLTIEAVFAGEANSAIFRLLDANDTQLATSSFIDNRQRIDWNVNAGEMFVVELSGTNTDVDLTMANLVQVSPDGSQMTVYGTAGDDTFEATVGSPNVLTVNGVRYESSQATTMEFFGGGGSDSATLTGSGGDDTATVNPTSATLAGAGYVVQLNDVASTTINGGAGNDNAHFYDSAGDDAFTGSPTTATMAGPGGTNTVNGFETIVATGGVGGSDTAELYDSPGNDLFVTMHCYGLLTGSGFSLQVISFDEVSAYAPNGGYDSARMYDSPGDDIFYATPAETTMYRSDGANTFLNRVRYFENVQGFASSGGYDVGFLFDSAGDDTFYAAPAEGTLRGPTGGGTQGDQRYSIRVKQFEEIRGDASQGGNDRAELHDGPGDDVFYATPNEGSLAGSGYYYLATDFEQIDAFASGGNDVARLFGSTGNDNFYGSPVESALYGAGYHNQTSNFEKVYADGRGGDDDRADLFDSGQVDLLEAAFDWARLSNTSLDFLYEVLAFDQVNATATTVGDAKDVTDPLDFILSLAGPWVDL